MSDTLALVTELDNLRAEVDRLTEERDAARRGARTLGQVIETQGRAALDATGLHHLIDETGDGDWGAVWESLYDVRDRADRAEAALARVTGDSMKVKLAEALDAAESPLRDADLFWAVEVARVLDVIRAVATDPTN